MKAFAIGYLIVFLFSLFLSLAFVPLIRRMAFWLNILDHPGDRKIHAAPVPYLGGIAVYIGFVSVVVISLFGLYALQRSGLDLHFLEGLLAQGPLVRAVSPKLFTLLVGATLYMIVGFLDDSLGARFDFRLKLSLQIAIAILMVVLGIRLDFLVNSFLNAVVTILWIVGMTNAFNLLDNMDGLSAGIAYIACMLFFFVAARQGQFFIGVIFLALGGSLLGFLYYNFHPAKIFLGDTGSLLIGFLMATIVVLQSFTGVRPDSLFPILMPVIILSVPIFDTFWVMFIRLRERRSIFQGDQRHLSHRLMDLGMSQSHAVLTLYALSFALGIGATTLDVSDRFSNAMILLQIVFMVLTLVALLSFTGKSRRS